MINYNTEKVEPIARNELFSLLSGSKFGPYRNFSLCAKEEIQKLWLEKINRSTNKANSKTISINHKNKMVGFIQGADLDWDSKLFGIPMYSIQELVVDMNQTNRVEILRDLISNILEWAHDHNYQFVLAKTYTNDILAIHALEQAGFLLVDTLLDYAVDFRKTPFSNVPMQKRSEDVIVRFAEPKDVKELEMLARVAFKNHFGRYHADPRLTNEQATQVYVEWMNSSIRGYADYFILAEINGKIAGVSIWKKPSELEQKYSLKLCHYSIGAIHPDFFGKKLFTLLTYEGMKLLENGTDVIEGPTHINNYPVQHGYNRLGWQIFDAHHSFHKWLD